MRKVALILLFAVPIPIAILGAISSPSNFFLRMLSVAPLVAMILYHLDSVFKSNLIDASTGEYGVINIDRWMMFISAHAVLLSTLLLISMLIPPPVDVIKNTLGISSGSIHLAVTMNGLVRTALFICFLVTLPLTLYIPWKFSYINATRKPTAYFDHVRIATAIVASIGIYLLMVVSVTTALMLF